MISLDRLQQIIPPDQALANKALATSMQQIGGITNLSLSGLATATSAIKTTRDLPQITALTAAVPASVANYFANTIAVGTGVNNTILITDILGTAAGWVSTSALTSTVAIMSSMDLTTLTVIYQTMSGVVNGDYGDPVTGPVDILTGPYAGTYADANEVFSTVLIPAAQAEITTLIATYPEQVATLNTDWTNMANQLVLEKTIQSSANLVFANLPANQRTSIYGFIFNLLQLGQDTTVGGTAQFVEDVSDLTTFTGQAVVAGLRSGTNQQATSSAGIIVSSNIPSAPNPPPPQAVLIPSDYTEAEAANLIIT